MNIFKVCHEYSPPQVQFSTLSALHDFILKLSSGDTEAQKNIANIQSHFVTPWARGYGLAKAMVDFAINSSKENNVKCLQLDIRETQEAAIHLFESKGFIKWGENPYYAFVNGKFIKGLYFYKNI